MKKILLLTLILFVRNLSSVIDCNQLKNQSHQIALKVGEQTIDLPPFVHNIKIADFAKTFGLDLNSLIADVINKACPEFNNILPQVRESNSCNIVKTKITPLVIQSLQEENKFKAASLLNDPLNNYIDKNCQQIIAAANTN